MIFRKRHYSVAHLSRSLTLHVLLATILASIGMVAISYHFLQVHAQQHLRALATIIASQSLTALEARDADASDGILAAIPNSAGIALSELYDADGAPLARRGNAHEAAADHFGATLVDQDIAAGDGRRLGRIVLESDDRPMLRSLIELSLWCGTISLIIGLSAMSLTRYYARRVLRPITRLRDAMQHLVRNRDFNHRAPPTRLIELEELRGDFNTLLAEIDARDRQLTDANATLQRIAYIDVLTGLPNRALFEQSIASILDRATRHEDRVAMIYLDLDALKTINDTLGHGVGDQLLAEIGARLRDWLPKGAIAARLGGDEFAVLIAPSGNPDEVAALTCDLQTRLDQPLRLNDQMLLRPSTSIGTAIYPDMTRCPKELQYLADRAMYAMKDKHYRLNLATHWDLADAFAIPATTEIPPPPPPRARRHSPAVAAEDPPMNEDMRIAFIGGGNMARSLIGGLVRAGTPGTRIAVAEPVETVRTALTRDFDVATHAEGAPAVRAADLVVLAVKPQVASSVCATLREAVQARKPLIVSIAAGIRIDRIEAWLGGDLAIVRCMPNTPALLGAGASALIANARADARQRAAATRLFEAVGMAAWIDDEALMDTVTALSGSGPAYFFLLAEALIDAATAQGLPRETARALAAQTCLGAGRMLAESGQTPAELRRRVTSPNGTTQAAIDSFEADGLRGLATRAVAAATRRSEALSDPTPPND